MNISSVTTYHHLHCILLTECITLYSFCKGADIYPSHMQRIDTMCSDVWSEHGDAIGSYSSFFIVLYYLKCLYEFAQRHTYHEQTYTPSSVIFC